MRLVYFVYLNLKQPKKINSLLKKEISKVCTKVFLIIIEYINNN